jgi:UDP-3-O-[3-hydroxymyristoyl] glucosamine N-acyltransferase
MKFTIQEIANRIQGDLDGEASVEINTLSKIEEALPGSITFLSNPKYTSYIYKTGASAVIVDRGFIPDTKLQLTLIRVNDPYSSFSKILKLFNFELPMIHGIDDSSKINKNSTISNKVYIGPLTILLENTSVKDNSEIHSHCFIGMNVNIGKNTIIKNGVKILSNTVIGDNCLIHPGVVIGSDGFGFAPQKNGSYEKIPQTGNVKIGNNVEIGANTTIDKATMGSTIINDGVKIDNQVQIAHNVEIGDNTVIAAQVGISGSTKIGKYCVIGGQAGIAGHLKIGNHVRIQGQTGVIKNIPNNKDVQGTPSLEYKDYYRSYAYFKKLPEIEKRLNKIEQK